MLQRTEQINKITIDSLKGKIEEYESTIEDLRKSNAECECDPYDYDFSDIDDTKSPEPIVMDFVVQKKNGFITSKPKTKKQRQTSENKYTMFVDYVKSFHYPESVMEVISKYVRWLLKNRKVEYSQWTTTINTLNTELCLLPNTQIRETALLDAFNSAFAGGYQKVFIDRYKYGKLMNTSNNIPMDNQKSVTSVEEVSSGVYKIVSERKDFVTDENGDIVTF